MKRVLLVTMFILLALSMQVYSQATCGGPCGGFTSTATQVNVNSNLTFTTSYTSGVTWSVSSGLSIISSSAGSITIKGTSVGTWYLCLTYNANGMVCSVCKVITVVDCPASPVVAFMYDPYASPPVVKATANVYSPSYSYTWTVNGVTTGPFTGQNQIAMPPSCGQLFDVSVTITSSTGCQRSSLCKRFYLECYDNYLSDGVDDNIYNNVIVNVGACTGGGDPPIEMSITNNLKDKVIIYPNPASGYITLTFEDETVRTIEVVDQEGTVIHQEIISGKKHSMDVRNFKKGQYFLRQRSGKTGEGMTIDRLLIE